MSDVPDIPTLPYRSTKDYDGDRSRRARILSQVVFVISLSTTAWFCWIAAHLRAGTAGFNPIAWLVFGIPPMLSVAAVFLLAKSNRNVATPKRLWIVPLLCFVLGPLIVESWFCYEEWHFKHEKDATGLRVPHRPRWYPFQNSGLFWDKQSVAAHD